jgi:hypothetical protein
VVREATPYASDCPPISQEHEARSTLQMSTWRMWWQRRENIDVEVMEVVLRMQVDDEGAEDVKLVALRTR